MSAQTLEFPCPSCQAPTRVPDDWAGRGGACPRCRADVVVPASSQPLLGPGVDQTRPAPVTKPCPTCGEQVRQAARACRHCGGYFDPGLRPRAPGEGNYRLASAWDRLLAYTLDRLVLLAPALVSVVLPGMVFERSDTAFGVGVMVALAWATVVSCGQWYLLAASGTTLGKRWRRIQVIRDDGQPLDFVHAVLLRSWIPICLVIGGTMFYVLGCAFVVIDKLFILGDSRRCLHDLLAATLVVEQDRWAFPGVAVPTAGDGQGPTSR